MVYSFLLILGKAFCRTNGTVMLKLVISVPSPNSNVILIQAIAVLSYNYNNGKGKVLDSESE